MWGPFPTDVLAHESGKRDGHVRVVSNETSVEISESEERLDFLDFSGGWPVLDDLDFRVVHAQAIWSDYEAQEVGHVNVEFAFFEFCEQAMSAKPSQNFADMFFMLGLVL